MIGLRLLHVLAGCDHSLTATGALPLLHRLRRSGHEVGVLCHGGARVGELAVEGMAVFHARRGRFPWWFSRRRDLLERLARWNPDLLHVHDLAMLPLALTMARPLGVPVIAACHELVHGDDDTTRPLHDPRIAWVVVPSEVHRAHAISRIGLERDRVTVLPYGVDLEVVTTNVARSPGALTVGAVAPEGDVGALVPLFSALAELQRDAVPLRAVIAATLADSDKLRALLVAAGLIDVAEILVDQPLRSLVHRIDLFVHGDRQGDVAQAVVEAMAAARPIVAIAAGGITDLVHDGANGLLVGADDVPALTAALRSLLADPARARALGKAGRQTVGERFDLDLITQAAVELYRNAASGSGSTNARAEGTTIYRRITEMRLKA